MKSRNSQNMFGFAFRPHNQSWQSNGKKRTGLESLNDLTNILLMWVCVMTLFPHFEND